MIFVFGSNEAGRHGKGAALFARQHYGAVYGIAYGRMGDAYAIPTKDGQLRTLPLACIAVYVRGFLRYAREHPELRFQVTRIGCGLAGYTDEDIAPMFASAPENCALPPEWTAHEESDVQSVVTKTDTLPPGEAVDFSASDFGEEQR